MPLGLEDISVILLLFFVFFCLFVFFFFFSLDSRAIFNHSIRIKTFLENEITGDFRIFQETFAQFSRRNERASNDTLLHPYDWTTEKIDFKTFNTVFPAENKRLETNFLAIFISCLESKPLKKCFWLILPLLRYLCYTATESSNLIIFLTIKDTRIIYQKKAK